MRKKQYIYLFAGLTAVAGFMTACSSSDDNVDPTPTINTQTVGVLMDDLTAQYQSTITNCLNPSGTRATGSGWDYLAYHEDWSNTDVYIPSTMPDEPSIPSDAIELTYSRHVDNEWGGYDESGWDLSHNGVYYVPAGKTVDTTTDPNRSFNLSGMTLYVAGTLKINKAYGGCTIYVLNTGDLELEQSDNQLLYNDNGTGIAIYNYGNINKASTGFYVASHEKLYNKGTVNYAGKEFKVQGTLYDEGSISGCASYAFEKGCLVNINGNLDMSGLDIVENDGANKLMEGYIHVGGKLSAKNLIVGSSGKLINECGIDIAENLTTNSTNDIYADYIHAGSLNQCASAYIKIGEGGFIKVDGTYENLNNGNDAGIELTSGTGTVAIFKAAKISFNSSGETGQILFFKAPNGGTIGVDCDLYSYNTHQNVTLDSVDLAGKGTAKYIGSVESAQAATFTLAAAGCNPGYTPTVKKEEKPDTTTTPETPDTTKDDPTTPIVVSTQHTHDISATCVQTDNNGNVYLSFHQRGNDQSGCIERLTTTGDQTELKQFVRDHGDDTHDGTIDFNHIALVNGEQGTRLYAVGNNLNGGFLGYLNVKSDGNLDVDAKDMGGLDSVSIARKTYAPLQLVKLQEAQANANAGYKATRANSGDGNAVIYNNGLLKVASTYGYESFDENLQSVYTKHTAGKGKHIATAPDGSVLFSYFTEQVTSSINPYKEVPLRIEKYAASDDRFENPTVSFAANDVTPNNGKNVILEYGGKIYSCQGSRGLFVYDATSGTQLANYKENIVTDAGKELNSIACNGVAVDDDYVYVAYGSRGLIILENKIADGTMKKLNSFVCGRSANYVTLDSNGYIYVAYGRNGLKVFKLAGK